MKMFGIAVFSLVLFFSIDGMQLPAVKDTRRELEPKRSSTLDAKCPTSNNRTPPPPARSCLDHLKRGANECGYYKIFDDKGNGFTVYCDMNSEPGSAWTLVISSSATYRNMGQFKSTPFKVNAPVNENSPNWSLYRLSLTRMNSLVSQNTHWRATCSYPKYGIDYRDYVRGSFADFNIMTYIGSGVCKKVELVNIRGHVCSTCTAKFWQNLNAYLLHIDSTSPGCGLDARAGAASSEDDFGYYGSVNKNFRCTADSNSSTQWWFGGYQ